jgi:hypothetical protein
MVSEWKAKLDARQQEGDDTLLESEVSLVVVELYAKSRARRDLRAKAQAHVA